jgi:hypothetical protein
MAKLHIGETEKGKAFSLPLELVTQTQAVLAKRGVGKSYLASVMAEEMLEAQQQVLVLDPTGAWFGLRSSPDGSAAGYPIVVFGGEHGDLPLEEHAGEVIARAVVERRFSAILDLSLFRKGQQRRFVTAFLENLYRLNREPVHLFVDEADDVCPQRPFGDEAQMVGAMEDVVKRGRKKGIGCTLITQRPADLAKQVLTQCEVLVSMRIVHPRDIAAIKEWVNVHADPEEAKGMIAGLPSLPVGTAWFWSPGWVGIFEQIKVRQRRTFDSGATPKPGEKARTPKVLANIDIAALGQEIASTAEQAKANDPKELRRQIAELQRQVQAKPATAPVAKPVEVRVEVPVLQPEQIEDLRVLIDKAQSVSGELASAGSLIAQALQRFSNRPAAPVRPAVVPSRPVVVHTPRKPLTAPTGNGSTEKLSKAERSILTVLAQHGASQKRKVALAAGYALTGGGFNNALGSLRSTGRIEGSDPIQITDAGLEALGQWAPLPHGQELIEHWLRELSKAEREIFQVVTEAYPSTLTKEEIAQRTPTQYEPTGGGFNNALGRLRTLELITRGTDIRASDELFA